jgi:hypothetical protein
MTFWRKTDHIAPGQCKSGRRILMKLTGKPPANTAEDMVKRIAKNRMEMPLEWLEKRVCHELYAEELRLTHFTSDIGLCGREFFRDEASLLLASIRPEFGFICEGE